MECEEIAQLQSLEIDILLEEIKVLSEWNLLWALIVKRDAERCSDTGNHCSETLLIAAQRQCRQAVERIEQKVRPELSAKHLKSRLTQFRAEMRSRQRSCHRLLVEIDRIQAGQNGPVQTEIDQGEVCEQGHHLGPRRPWNSDKRRNDTVQRGVTERKACPTDEVDEHDAWPPVLRIQS